jgi:ribonuclease P protein component
MDLTFPRTKRLSSQHDFDLVFAQSIKASHRHFIALFRANEQSLPRLGIILKKSVIKSAVKRVATRRFIRESFRLHQDSLKGLDIIVLMRSECRPFDGITIRKNVDDLWQAVLSKQLLQQR